MGLPKQSHCKNGHPFDAVNTYISPKSQKRLCRTCQSDRVRRLYYQDLETNRKLGREHMLRWRHANKEHYNRTWVEHRKGKKQWVDQYKAEHSCNKCGEADPRCLDFHHRNPREKKFLISLAIARASLKRIQAEVAKCDILCANCHRKLHATERAEGK